MSERHGFLVVVVELAGTSKRLGSHRSIYACRPLAYRLLSTSTKPHLLQAVRFECRLGWSDRIETLLMWWSTLESMPHKAVGCRFWWTNRRNERLRKYGAAIRHQR